VREGFNVAIVGPPNAGKSSLLNALLGEERAIVSEIPGTTRDTIEERIAIDGVPVRLVDTAGIRAHADRLEAEGIARTRRALEAARIALVVLDGSKPAGAPEREILEATAHRTRIVFLNKGDLGRSFDYAACGVSAQDDRVVSGSVRDPQTIAALKAAIAQAGWSGERPDLERPHLAALYELDAVRAAREALGLAQATLESGEPADLIAGELQRAFSALGHVTERIAAEEVLDGVFSRFCIGK
jgi:tRNA modification GTPase